MVEAVTNHNGSSSSSGGGGKIIIHTVITNKAVIIWELALDWGQQVVLDVFSHHLPFQAKVWPSSVCQCPYMVKIPSKLTKELIKQEDYFFS